MRFERHCPRPLAAACSCLAAAAALVAGCNAGPAGGTSGSGSSSGGTTGAVVLPLLPQAVPDRTTLGFGAEFGEGVYLGTVPIETLQVRNGGQQPLLVSAIAIDGTDAAAFRAVLADAGGAGVASLDSALIQVEFSPPDAGRYQAQLFVASNAANTPQLVVDLVGLAVRTSLR